MIEQSHLLFCVMDIHFTLAAEWHDKTAHSLLSELYIVHSISDDQVVLRNAVQSLFCELLEELALLELFDIFRNSGFVLHDFDALYDIFPADGLNLHSEAHLKSDLSRLA